MLARFGPLAPAGRPNSARMAQQTTMFLEGVYPRVRPDAALLWYNDPDITFHHEGLGSPAAVAALAALDPEFGRLMDLIASPAPRRPVSSDERPLGQACVVQCSSRWRPYLKQ